MSDKPSDRSVSSALSAVSKQANILAPKKSWLEATKAYFDHRVMFLLFLGFVAGLPYMLVYSSLGLWLNEAGVELEKVTMFGWAMLGYSFKFIWAPMIDALQAPLLGKWLGRRRGWLLVSQLGIIGSLLLIASINPISDVLVQLMAVAAVLLGFSAANQDIVLDAYRIEIAPPSMQPILSSVYIVGYRIGMIASGAGALYLADYLGSTMAAYSYDAWRLTYLAMAALMGVGVLTTLTIYEPNTKFDPKNGSKQRWNQRIMGAYAVLALIPSIIYGLWYLLNKVLVLVFSSMIMQIPESLTNLMLKYWSGVSLFIPIAILLLLFNQPKFNYKTAIEVVSEGKVYKRLTIVFFIALAGFIATFIGFGKLLPVEIDNRYLTLLAELIKLIVSLGAASLVGYILVKLNFVDKTIAKKTWVDPFVDFFKRYGKKAILLLLLIGFYRISDIVAGNISNLFYQGMGFSKTDIASAVKLVGLIMAILGGLLGGLLTQKMSLMRAMMLGAFLASFTNLFFILLTYHPGDLKYMYFAVITDNLASGLASAVFIAFLSALTSIRFTAVQYAIFSSLMTFTPKLLAGYSGGIVTAIGYSQFFMLTFIIGIPVLLLIYLVDKHIVIGDNDDIYGDAPVVSDKLNKEPK